MSSNGLCRSLEISDPLICHSIFDQHFLFTRVHEKTNRKIHLSLKFKSWHTEARNQQPMNKNWKSNNSVFNHLNLILIFILLIIRKSINTKTFNGRYCWYSSFTYLFMHSTSTQPGPHSIFVYYDTQTISNSALQYTPVIQNIVTCRHVFIPNIRHVTGVRVNNAVPCPRYS